MHIVTYIGTPIDDSESVTINGVEFPRGEAVEVEDLDPQIEGNPTFHVETEDGEEVEVDEEAEAAKAKEEEEKAKEEAEKADLHATLKKADVKVRKNASIEHLREEVAKLGEKDAE